MRRLRHRLCIWAFFICLWGPLNAVAAIAASTDCKQLRQVESALRTVVQGGVQLDQRVVAQQDPLERAWLREDTRVTYDIALDACAQTAGQAVWMYRMGGPYRISADGKALTPIQPYADIGPNVYNGRVPALFDVPLNAKSLRIEIVTLPYVPMGIIRLELGPFDNPPQSRSLEASALTGFNDASSTVFVVGGMLALSTWLLRRRDLALLTFGLACVAWALRGLAYQSFALPLPALFMEQLNPFFILWTCFGVMLSTFYSIRGIERRTWAGLLLWTGVLTLGFALTLALQRGSVAIRAVAFVTAFGYMFACVAALWRQTQLSREQAWTLMLGVLAVLAGALHDIGMVTGWVKPDHWTYITPGFAVMLLCYTLAGSRYLVRTLNLAERSNEALEVVIASKTTALEASYALLRARDHENGRQSGRQQEREHLLREMHDGLGAQLMTTLRGVERGSFAPAQVQQALQDSLDDLRMLMDSTDIGRTLVGALVAWRSRWSPRLAALGIEIGWVLDERLEQLDLPADTVLQIVRILQEATVNVVKHSQASKMTVHAVLRSNQAGTDSLTLSVQDDGCGLSPAKRTGRGLVNMAQRAQKIGGTLHVHPANDLPHGTLVQLALVLTAPNRAALPPWPPRPAS
jgi:signal transduction histidine kinase